MIANNNSSGSILPWAALSIVTSLSVIGLALSTTTTLVASKHHLVAKEQSEYLTTLTQAILLHITRLSDQQPFTIIPRTFSATDEISLPQSIASSVALNKSFNGIAVMKITAAHPFRVSSWYNDQATLCPLSDNPWPFSTPVRLWLSITVDGFSVWGNRSGTRLVNNQLCMSIPLEPVNTMVVQSHNPNPGRVLVPILSESIYYTDDKRTLRHVSLYNGAIIENQPVAQLEKGLLFEVSYGQYSPHHVTVSATLTDSKHRDYLVNSTTAIPRQLHFDYLSYWLNK